jgi:L-ornithine N5-oxygenase
MVSGEEHCDLVCVGCGPANLALVAAIHEAREARPRPLDVTVLERKSAFSWHPDMQLPDADCQVSFLKDLATLRNPRSEFTFLNFLHETGRLIDFIDLNQSTVSRDDFAAYFAWVADRLGAFIRYGCRVMRVEPIRGRRGVEGFRVLYDNGGGAQSVIGRQVVVAIGGQPVVPIEFAPALGDRCFHSGQFLSSLKALSLGPQDGFAVAIVGTGQSAVDIATYLMTRYTKARVTVVARGYSFRTADDNPFLNKFFTSENAADIHALPTDRRAQLADDYYDTGIAVADMRLVRKLYEIVYREKSQGRNRFSIVNYREVRSAETNARSVQITTRHILNGAEERLTTDMVVLATGYSRSLREPFLRAVEELIYPDGSSHPSLDADYNLMALKGQPASMFLQGYAAYSHGVGDEALSIVATRAQVIQAAIDQRIVSDCAYSVREAHRAQHS